MAVDREPVPALAEVARDWRGEVADEADRAAAYAAFEVEAAVRNHRDRPKTVQLFADDGVTVLCFECGAPIDPLRLKALPEAAFCVECQRALELRRKHHGP